MGTTNKGLHIMATKKQKEELINVLKFTPVQAVIRIQGYGGEAYSGRVSREIYDFFKENKYDIEEYASDWDGEWSDKVPEELQPFSPGSPYDCDSLFHASGAELSNLNSFVVENNETNETIWEVAPGYSELVDAGVSVDEMGGEDYDDLEDGTVVFWGGQGEKGCFFEAEFTLNQPFDPKKLRVTYENCDGWYIINGVEYDGEELDGSSAYSTTGKWSEHKWVIVGDEEVYEAVPLDEREEDEVAEDWDPAVELEKIAVPFNFTPWFEAEVKPEYKGEYEVSLDAEWPLSGIIRAEWTGRTWKDSDGKKVKIKGWRGLDSDPTVNNNL